MTKTKLKAMSGGVGTVLLVIGFGLFVVAVGILWVIANIAALQSLLNQKGVDELGTVAIICGAVICNLLAAAFIAAILEGEE